MPGWRPWPPSVRSSPGTGRSPGWSGKTSRRCGRGPPRAGRGWSPRRCSRICPDRSAATCATPGSSASRSPAPSGCTQQGRMRLGPGQRWVSLDAEEHYSVQPPGFVWAGTARLGPLPLDGTDHASHKEQASTIRRYIIWRNNHAYDERLRRIAAKANVALYGSRSRRRRGAAPLARRLRLALPLDGPPAARRATRAGHHRWGCLIRCADRDAGGSRFPRADTPPFRSPVSRIRPGRRRRV